METNHEITTIGGLYKQRLDHRIEFLRRSKRFQEWKDRIDKELGPDLGHFVKDDVRSMKRIEQVAKEMFPHDQIKGLSCIVDRYILKNIMPDFGNDGEEDPIHWNLETFLAMENLSPIEIIFSNGDKISRIKFLDYFEKMIFQYKGENFDKSLEDWKEERKDNSLMNEVEDADSSDLLALDCVDKKENTIMIKIHIDRQQKDILHDIVYLLKLLKWESDLLDTDLGKSKKPQWDVYDKYLQVYDLKEANPKMEWSEIAKIVFPEEVERERKAVHRKTKKKELATDSAVSKVFRYWKEANKMINEGGWKQI